LLQLRPSVERLIVRRVGSRTASVEISQTPCSALYATTGSLAASAVPGRGAFRVTPGSSPLRHVRPLSFERAHAMFDAAPLKRRPVWKAATVVPPQVKLSGSTCVSCCESSFRWMSRESRRLTISQSAAMRSLPSAVTVSRPAPQATVSTAPSYCAEMRSFPPRARTRSAPPRGTITSAEAVPTTRCGRAVPSMRAAVAAPAESARTASASASSRMRPA
jgi:hypothetical protein